MTESVVERYIRLGLRLDRHEEGTVDAYFGPPEPAEAVQAEPLREPATLVADAEELLSDGELGDGWLRDQVLGLRTFAAGLAGETMAYADEVEGTYRVRPTWTDEAVFAACHEQLEELLPGEGTLGERHMRWHDSMVVPTDRIERALLAVIEEARRQTRGLIDLPEGEGVDLELVTDVPWMGFNFYQGGLRGRIAANTGIPTSAYGLLILAMHETYPGHQAERACKEQLLVRGRGMLEESIVLAPTPQSVVAEGLGCLAPYVLLEGDGADVFTGIIRRETGIDVDLAQCVAISRATELTRWSDVNAALMLYERDASDAEARAYAERWGLMDAEKAAHLVRFIRDTRTYVVNYPAGLQLCEAYARKAPQNLRRLLTEQLRVSDLTQATGGQSST